MTKVSKAQKKAFQEEADELLLDLGIDTRDFSSAVTVEDAQCLCGEIAEMAARAFLFGAGPAEKQLAELREAAHQALLFLGAEAEIYGCGECEVQISDGTLGALHLCDKCAANGLVRLESAPYAPALRRLRALLAG